MVEAGFTVWGDSISGNCQKVRFVARRLSIAHTWRETSVLDGETRSPAFLALNPAGQVPIAVWPDGRVLAQSNAIMLHLAEGSDLIPSDAWDRAQMFQWLFWEQYSHEPAIAVRRFQVHYLKRPDPDIDPALMTRGRAVLAIMDSHLATRAWFVGPRLSLADLALVAYTRLAHEGGFDLADFPAVAAWVTRVEAEPGVSGA